MDCVYCSQKCSTPVDCIVHRDIYRPFCDCNCAITFCRFHLGLLGLEQQITYLARKYGLKMSEIAFKQARPYKGIDFVIYQEASSDEKVDLEKTEGIYEKFLQERIGHNVSDFFSLDSLIQ